MLALSAVAAVALVLFVLRQRRARYPLYDLEIAARRTFWVAAVGGIIVFGSLMGAMFIGQQFLQNVLGYSTLSAGAAILPAAFCMVLVAPRSAKLVESRGARFTLLCGYVVHPAGLRDDAAAVERGYSLLDGRARLRLRRHRRWLRGHARFALADRVGAGDQGRNGFGHGGPAARLGWRDDAVALRRAACGGLRRFDVGRDRRIAECRGRHHHR